MEALNPAGSAGGSPFEVLVEPSAYRKVAADWTARDFIRGGVAGAGAVVFVHLLYPHLPGFRFGFLLATTAALIGLGVLALVLFSYSLRASLALSGAVATMVSAAFAYGAGPTLSVSAIQACLLYAAGAPLLVRRRSALILIPATAIADCTVFAVQPGLHYAVVRSVILVTQMALYAAFMLWFAGKMLALAEREKEARAATDAARAELSDVDERRRNFLHEMSHQLRTPLNAVIGFSEMLCAGMAGPLTAKQTDYLGDIRASGSHLLALVDDVLDVGKVEKGRIELTLETCLVRNLVGQSVAVFRDQAQRAGISLTSDCPRSVGAVLADERKVKQILLNLLSNAIKFTPRGGRVEVRAREAGEVVFITVTDDGPGVPEGDRDRIFAAFEQGPVATTGAPGTGLGLAVARRLAEAHGGTLGVAPETDRGATFLLSLPRRPVSAGSASTSAGDAGEPSGAEQAIEPGALEGRSVLAHLEGRDGLARSRARIAGTAALIESVTFGLLPVLPGAPRHLHLWGWPYITIFGVVAGIALLLPRSRVSANGLYAGMIVAVASTGWYVYSVRHGLTSSLAMILMLQGMAAFTFFRLRRAAVIGVEIAVVYGATVLHETHVGVGILRWAVTVGLVAASAIMARWLPYLSALAQSERQARADAEEVNRQLRTASHHKSEFLASMSHELRTPLNAIIGFADALQQEMFGALAPKQAEYVADIAAAGHHLLDLINDILDLAKADAGRLQLARRRTALAEVLEPACRRASEAAERASVGFEWRLDPDVADLDVDPVRLAQAVESVVRDAVAFTPTGGTVSLDARIHAGQVLIGVGHTGPAPALTDPERLFAPFEYGGDTHPGPGNWVGLALARQIVQLHGGSLSLECRAEQGSSFTLTLPTAGAAGPPPHPGDPRAQPAPSAS